MEANFHIADRRGLGLLRFAQSTVGTLFAPPYRAAFNSRRRRYLAARTQVAGAPVIAVGNIAMGGSGKTPVCCALYAAARKTKRRGAIVLKLSKDRRHFLDELLIYASRLTTMDAAPPRVKHDEQSIVANLPSGVVCAHTNKMAGIKAMAAREDVDFVIVDDAHQLYSLQPALSICLLHPADLKDRLFPRGMLREEIEAASRADYVLMREDGSSGNLPVETHGTFRLEERAVLPVADLMTPWVEMGSGERISEGYGPRGSGVAFAGIGRPESFEESLKKMGMQLAVAARFPDHHEYSAADLHWLRKLGSDTGAGHFITTEKDGCRLLPLMLRARYAQGYNVCWPAGLLPQPTVYLPNLIVALEEMWPKMFFARVNASLPDELASRFLEVIGAPGAGA
jgi:tetraacyldisaccharide 4'-kinase